MVEYRPGVCNIGRSQRRARRAAGVLGMAAAAVVVVAVAVGDGPPTAYLAAFPFLVGAFLGLIQARLRFCVAFGALARYDFTGSGGTAGTVEDREAIRRDRRRALLLLAYAVVAAAVVTGAVYAVATVA